MFEEKLLFNVNPLVPRGLNPIEGVPAPSRYGPGILSPVVRGDAADYSFSGTFTLDAEGHYDFELALSAPSFSFSAEGSVTYDLHQHGTVGTDVSIASFSLDQTANVSWQFSGYATGSFPVNLSSQQAVTVHDPGLVHYAFDYRHWYTVNWYSIVAQISASNSLNMINRSWSSLSVTEDGDHSYTFAITADAGWGDSGTDLVNNSLTGENFGESVTFGGTGSLSYTDRGAGTFTLSEGGSRLAVGGGSSGVIFASLDYAESGASDYSMTMTQSRGLAGVGVDLANTIAADPLGGPGSTSGYDYEGEALATYLQSGEVDYTLTETGSLGSAGLAFSNVTHGQEGSGTFSYAEDLTLDRSRSAGLSASVEGDDQYGGGGAPTNGFGGSDALTSGGSHSHADTGTATARFTQEGDLDFTLTQVGTYAGGGFAFATVVYDQSTEGDFDYTEFAEYTRTGTAQRSNTAGGGTTRAYTGNEEAGYGGVGEYELGGSDEYDSGASESFASDGSATASLTQSGTFDTGLYRAGTYTSAGGFSLNCYVLDVSGSSAFTLEEDSDLTLDGDGEDTSSSTSSTESGSSGESSHDHAAPGGSGFGNGGSSDYEGSQSTGGGGSAASSYRFDGAATMTFGREGDSNFTLHQTGVGPGAAFEFSQEGQTGYESSYEETRTLTDGVTTVTGSASSESGSGFNQDSDSGFTGTGRSWGQEGGSSGSESRTGASGGSSTGTFTGTVARGRTETGTSSYTVAEHGLWGTDTFALDEYAFRTGSQHDFTAYEITTRTFSGTGQGTWTDSADGSSGSNDSSSRSHSGQFGNSASEGFLLGATGTSQSSSGGSFTATGTSAFSFSGAETVTSHRSGAAGSNLYREGVYTAAAGYALSSYVLAQGADGTFTTLSESSRVTTGVATITHTEGGSGGFDATNSDSTGRDGTALGGYAGSTDYDSEVTRGGTSGSSSAYTARSVEVRHFTDRTFSSRDDDGAESYALSRVGQYSNGSFTFVTVASDQGSAGSYADHDESLYTWTSVSNGTFSQTDHRSNSSSFGHENTSAGSDRFGATTFAQSSGGGGSAGGSGLGTYSSVGTFQATVTGLDSTTDDAGGSHSSRLHRAGSYSNGSLSLTAMTLQQESAGTFANEALHTEDRGGWVQQSTHGTNAGSSNESSNDAFGFNPEAYLAAGNLAALGYASNHSASSGGSGDGGGSGESSFTSDSVSSYAYTALQTVTRSDSGANTATLYQAGGYTGGKLSLSSFVDFKSSQSGFTYSDDSTSAILDGFSSFTEAEEGSGTGDVTRSVNDGAGSADEFRFDGSTAHTSNPTAGSNYSATGDPGAGGVSGFNVEANSTAGVVGSRSSGSGSEGSMTSGGNSSYQLQRSGTSSFGSDSHFRFDQSGASSYSVYQAGRYSNGSVTLDSYAHSQGSAGTHSQHQSGHRTETVEGTELATQGGTESGTWGSLGSSTGSAGGVSGFATATATSSGSGSGSGSSTRTFEAQSTYGYTRTSTETTTYDADGASTFAESRSGTFSGSGFDLASVRTERSSSSTYESVVESSVTEEGTLSRTETSTAQESFGSSFSASEGVDTTDAYDGGDTGSADASQSAGGSGGGGGVSTTSLFQSYTQIRSDVSTNARGGSTSSSELHEGRYALGSMTLDGISRTNDGDSHFTFSQTSTTDIVDGTSESSSQESGTQTSTSAGTFASGYQGVAASDLTSSAGGNLQFSGTYSYFRGVSSSHAFSSHEEYTEERSGEDSFSVSQEGVYSNGSLALSHFSSFEGASETFVSHQESSHTVEDGSSNSSYSNTGRGTGGGTGSTGYEFSTSSTAEAAGQSSSGGDSTGTLTSSGSEEATFSGFSTSSVTSSGGSSRSLYHEGAFSLGSFALESYVLDRHSDSASESESTSERDRSGTSLSSSTLVRVGGANSNVASQYGVVDTGAATYTGTIVGTLTQSRTTTFEYAETTTGGSGGSDSSTEHQSGTFGNGSLSLACYTLDTSGDSSYSQHREVTSSSSADVQATDALSGTDDFDHEAGGGAHGFGTSGNFSRTTNDSYTVTGTQTSTSDSGGSSSFALRQEGTYGNAAWSLSCISYSTGSTSTSSYEDEGSQTQSGTGVSGAESWGRSGESQHTMTLAQAGSYGNASLTLSAHQYEETSHSCFTSSAVGDPVWTTRSRDYTASSSGEDSSRHYESGSYGSGRFNLSSYVFWESGSSNSESDESGTFSTTVDQGSFTRSEASTDNYLRRRSGTFSGGQYSLPDVLDQGSGFYTYTFSEEGYHSAGSLAGTYRRDESEQSSYTLAQTGSFSGQSLSVSSHTSTQGSLSSYTVQRILATGVPDYLRSEEYSRLYSEQVTGSGAFGSFTRAEAVFWLSRGQGAGLGGFASEFDRSEDRVTDEEGSTPLAKDIGLLSLAGILPPVKDNAVELVPSLSAPMADALAARWAAVDLRAELEAAERWQAWLAESALCGLASPAVILGGNPGGFGALLQLPSLNGLTGTTLGVDGGVAFGTLAMPKLLHACFAAGTALLTGDGEKVVEELQPGDRLLSRAEECPDAVVDVQVVQEVFVRTGRIWDVWVGGQRIRTTPEHPFWVRGKGWTVAALVEPGDELSSHDGAWVRVEASRDTGLHERVYNVRVWGHHTYFVGRHDWGFSVWAHNDCDGEGKGRTYWGWLTGGVIAVVDASLAVRGRLREAKETIEAIQEEQFQGFKDELTKVNPKLVIPGPDGPSESQLRGMSWKVRGVDAVAWVAKTGVWLLDGFAAGVGQAASPTAKWMEGDGKGARQEIGAFVHRGISVSSFMELAGMVNDVYTEASIRAIADKLGIDRRTITSADFEWLQKGGVNADRMVLFDPKTGTFEKIDDETRRRRGQLRAEFGDPLVITPRGAQARLDLDAYRRSPEAAERAEAAVPVGELVVDMTTGAAGVTSELRALKAVGQIAKGAEAVETGTRIATKTGQAVKTLEAVEATNRTARGGKVAAEMAEANRAKTTAGGLAEGAETAKRGRTVAGEVGAENAKWSTKHGKWVRQEAAADARTRDLIRRITGEERWAAGRSSYTLSKGQTLTEQQLIDLSEYWQAEMSQVHYADGTSEIFRGPSSGATWTETNPITGKSTQQYGGASVRSSPSRERDIVRIEHTEPTRSVRPTFEPSDPDIDNLWLRKDRSQYGDRLTGKVISRDHQGRIISRSYDLVPNAEGEFDVIIDGIIHHD